MPPSAATQVQERTLGIKSKVRFEWPTQLYARQSENKKSYTFWVLDGLVGSQKLLHVNTQKKVRLTSASACALRSSLPSRNDSGRPSIGSVC